MFPSLIITSLPCTVARVLSFLNHGSLMTIAASCRARIHHEPISLAQDQPTNRRGMFRCPRRQGRSIYLSLFRLKLTCFPLKYGGSLENRARFILEVVNAIKAKLPSDRFVIAAKLSCHDCKLLPPNLTSSHIICLGMRRAQYLI